MGNGVTMFSAAYSKPLKQRKPMKPNAFISDKEWEAIRANGTIATLQLARILSSTDFDKLPMKEQLVAIKLAQDASYRPMVVAFNDNDDDDEDVSSSSNAIRKLAQTATLPEHTKRREREAEESIRLSDEQGRD